MSCLQLCLLLVLALTSVAGYTNKYDNINLDQILNNDRFLTSYLNCLLDKGRCSADAAELKRDIPDALHTRCANCTPRQREGTDKVIRFLIERKPHLFKQLEQKYDPSGYYRRNYSG